MVDAIEAKLKTKRGFDILGCVLFLFDFFQLSDDVFFYDFFLLGRIFNSWINMIFKKIKWKGAPLSLSFCR